MENQILFTLEGINYTDLFEAFAVGRFVTIEVENYPSIVTMTFSLLGFTKALTHMAEKADQIF